MGRSEVELMQVVVDGITLLVKMEKLLEKGKSIESLIPEGTKYPDEPMGPQVSLQKKIILKHNCERIDIKVTDNLRRNKNRISCAEIFPFYTKL